jgi:adenylosuccinate synthase
MIQRVVLISGKVSSGKSALARGLSEQFGFRIARTRDILLKRARKTAMPRLALQRIGDGLDRTSEGKWVLDGLLQFIQAAEEDQSLVVDSVRTANQIEKVREAFGKIVTHIHVTAPPEVLERRYFDRYHDRLDHEPSFSKVQSNRTERTIESLAAIADVVIDTNRCTEADVLVRAACHLRLLDTGRQPLVDVLVGGQYGSEGKGQIAAFLAPEYDLLIRVGGPNAGHKVFERPQPYTHHHLPSGTRRNVGAKLLLGAGAVLNVESLLREIADCQVDKDRLSIDPCAIVITPEDIENEQGLGASIGSTRQGVGFATIRRIRRDSTTAFAKDTPALKPYIRDSCAVLEQAYVDRLRIMLEGTQGTGLSLYHGHYPYVTSRDTTVSGCLAEAGIAPRRVRRTIMVCRTYPIRVESPPGGTSGPMSQEISFEEVSKRSGIDLERLLKIERTSTTNRARRVGEFDWVLLRRAALLNGPTDIALTFADYLAKVNESAMRFDQLDPATVNFVSEVERVSGASVSLLATGFGHRSVIDRRLW